MDDDVRTELEKAAEMFAEAPKRLRAAIVSAGERGETSLEIAKTINFAYSPDYVARIIREAIGPRKPGRRAAAGD
ncbi:hypothetical protein HS041_12125 [Planomonospora sp. ID67723]|uniref:hypothetical protein n=1 Tax=Planomonospora sp. ID67723 TaxID=2738134 RepID=UPI0018C3B46F|nr:hypothetical protein [Planomonospora sp. ID67723]MBG0828515.1 hypothetical protein [Planomonospora sp. ID67723]